MGDIKRLIQLARDREGLALGNPLVDLELLGRWERARREAARLPPKKYELQRAFEDSAQDMVRHVQMRARRGES